MAGESCNPLKLRGRNPIFSGGRMSRHGRLSLADTRAAFRLVGECTELGADPYAWRVRLLEGLCALTGALGGMGGESEGAFGGESRLVQLIYIGFDETNRRRHEGYMAEAAYLTIDTPLLRFMQAHRMLTTRSHEQLIAPDEWRRGALFNEYFRPSHIDDRLLAIADLPGDDHRAAHRKHGVTLYRARGDRPFTARDRRLVHLVLEELGALVDTKLVTCGGRDLRALSPRLQQVRDLLLSGCSDKEIAVKCDLAPSTVREYITTIYRRYGVSSRAGLLALFLRWQPRGRGQ